VSQSLFWWMSCSGVVGKGAAERCPSQGSQSLFWWMSCSGRGRHHRRPLGERVSIPVLVDELFGVGDPRSAEEAPEAVSIPVLVDELFGARLRSRRCGGYDGGLNPCSGG